MAIYEFDTLTLGLVMVIAGVALVFLGMILETLGGVRKSAKIRTGGAVLIGPFPIVFGDKELIKYSLILLLILVVLTITFILIPGVVR